MGASVAKRLAEKGTPEGREERLSPDHSLAFVIRRAHLAFDRLLTPRLARHGVKAGYWNYLRALWLEDGITQRRLSAITSVTETTTVALIKGMIAEGFITRTRSKDDKRKSVVCLTDSARQLEPVLMPYASELNGIALKDVDSADLAACFRVIKQVAENLEAVSIDAVGEQA